MSAFPVVFAACVLVPYPLVDVILRLADQGIFRPLWSEDILLETRRTLIETLGKTPESTDKRLKAMRDSFIDAEAPATATSLARCAITRRTGTFLQPPSENVPK